MPNENESKFKELLGDLNFFNKIASTGKGLKNGLFKSRDKALTHPDDCPCKECKAKQSLTVQLFTKDEIRNWRGGTRNG